MSAVPGAVAGSIRSSSRSSYTRHNSSAHENFSSAMEEKNRKDEYFNNGLARHISMAHVVNFILRGYYKNKYLEELTREIFYSEKTKEISKYINLDSDNINDINVRLFYFISSILDELYDEFNRFILNVSTIKTEYESTLTRYKKVVEKAGKE